MDIVLLRLGGIYLVSEDFDLARDVFMRSCATNPSANAWFGLGVSCYRLGELVEAEDALAEANMYDNTFPEVSHILIFRGGSLNPLRFSSTCCLFVLGLGLLVPHRYPHGEGGRS